jgi:Neurochondrin
MTRQEASIDSLHNMQVSSSKENRAAEIDQCLNLLSPSSSDESKFTALLILPRLLDSNDHATIQRVFNKMNFKFIERLMKSSMSSNIISIMNPIDVY